MVLKYILIIFLAHIGLLALKVKNKQISPIEKTRVIKTRIIKKKKKKRLSKKSKRMKRLSKAFSARNIISHNFKVSDYYIGQLNGSSSGELYLFDLVDEILIYPKIFVDYLQRGSVKCHLYIYGEEINLKFTKCKGNRFIKTYFLNEFQKALKLVKNKKKFRIKINTEYRLTTDRNKKSHTKNLDSSWYFYRQAYAPISTTQKTLHVINKVLINMTNWLTLLDYLPKNKKALLLEKRYFDKLKSHPFYNL